ncbi:MAG: hypothetical protein RPT12_15265 [Vibrio anguillarum]|nr:hypothetical protein [Vibrio anguillarum]
MKHMLSAPEIYLYRESVDFRKSINGLAAIIESDTDLPLGSGALRDPLIISLKRNRT